MLRCELRPMHAPEATHVAALVIDGLTERWGCYRADLNPDLQDLVAFYAGSVVLVAIHDGIIVGTGILHPTGEARAQIVRMSVAPAFRRQGIGSLILEGLLDAARRRSVLTVTLETTASWQSAVRFYAQHGFTRAQVIGDDQHFVLHVPAAAPEAGATQHPDARP